MTAYPFYIVDVFAETHFSGNQLAVIRGAPTTDRMQRIAHEMDYSETTFITDDAPQENGGFNVRIFTVANELPFAGHPTLGTAYIIRRVLQENQPDKVLLNMKIGQIPVWFEDDGVIWMQQRQPEFMQRYTASEAAAFLDIAPDIIDTRYPVEMVSTGVPFIIVPLRTRDAVNRARLNLSAFPATEEGEPLHGVLLFAPDPVDNRNTFHARMMADDGGQVLEDAATGSANGCLAGWLARHEYGGSGQFDVRVEQGYAINRQSLLYLRSGVQDGEISVQVGGKVQFVAEGTLYDEG